MWFGRDVVGVCKKENEMTLVPSADWPKSGNFSPPPCPTANTGASNSRDSKRDLLMMDLLFACTARPMELMGAIKEGEELFGQQRPAPVSAFHQRKCLALLPSANGPLHSPQPWSSSAPPWGSRFPCAAAQLAGPWKEGGTIVSSSELWIVQFEADRVACVGKDFHLSSSLKSRLRNAEEKPCSKTTQTENLNCC